MVSIQAFKQSSTAFVIRSCCVPRYNRLLRLLLDFWALHKIYSNINRVSFSQAQPPGGESLPLSIPPARQASQSNARESSLLSLVHRIYCKTFTAYTSLNLINGFIYFPIQRQPALLPSVHLFHFLTTFHCFCTNRFLRDFRAPAPYSRTSSATSPFFARHQKLGSVAGHTMIAKIS
ncbi:uncharacterized protein LY89DRAFT_64183 [Mollisia scopiformis]|uniref:Uncharacterized protein n=1 Tax=Mollisia scopiformis TaxID=149040 RepID=A0A194X9E3_MOLSC|nr:uncharacterized protein LY89DRAFT_64183 [Mollisia scopiformis]KUJ16788.1 hypothetical protein LY89DRAFT_64183 [Mollisia scopiformis]